LRRVVVAGMPGIFLHYKKRTCRDWGRQVLAEQRKTY